MPCLVPGDSGNAARFAWIALLGQQSLRATTTGGRYAVEQMVRAHFGDGFRQFEALRHSSNGLGIPDPPTLRYSKHREADRAACHPPAAWDQRLATT